MSDDNAQEPRSFEDALTQLEQIIRSLDAGQTSLDFSLKNYERGIKLLRYCHATLQNAERKIEILRRVSRDGSLETEQVSETNFSTKVELFDDHSSSTAPIIRKKRVKKIIPPTENDFVDPSLFKDEMD